LNNSKRRKTSVVALLFLALALLASIPPNQQQETTFSPTIDKITIDNEIVFDTKTGQPNQITNNAILNRKASTITLFKNENKVQFQNTRLKDITKTYFKDIKTGTIEKHIDGTVKDFVWLENAPSGGEVELPSTYDAIYRCTGNENKPTCKQLKPCSNTDTDTNCYLEKNQKTRVILDHFSGIFGVDINILNIQSYPTVGGNWTVMFNTTGTANLIISAVNSTTWSNTKETEDLKFLEIKCGDQTLNYTWQDSTLFIQNYTCNQTGYETSKVLTTGSHHLKFRFRDIEKYAHNFASGPSSIIFISPTLQNNSHTSDDRVYINITSTDNLNQSILQWINSSGQTNISMSNSSLNNWYLNMTSLTEHAYNYSIWAQNTSSVWQQSNHRYVTIDTTKPFINFTGPTEDNNTYLNKNHTYINTTITDTGSPNNLTALIDWNRSLVGWWRFNEEAGENTTFFRDWSTYGNNGTNSCSLTVWMIMWMQAIVKY